jgi:ABC-type nickel/cobalt efflux system permease component RcnA
VALELGGGLLIFVLGAWLLMRRLGGQADHVHLFGHHHGHEHGHSHDHVHVPVEPGAGWGRVVWLGIAGGIVPCGEAIFLFLLSVQRRPGLAFPLLLAFSAGLAAVLVALGVSVVHARRASENAWGERPWMKRVARALPVVSALVITLLGVWLLADGMNSLRNS